MASVPAEGDAPSLVSPKPGGASDARPKRKPLTRRELRSKAVYRAVEKLLEATSVPEAKLWGTARILDGQEFLQLVEERALAGVCGYPGCTTNAAPASGGAPVSALKSLVGAAQGGSDSTDVDELTCGPSCAAAVRQLAARLGNADRAQQRFDYLFDEARAARAGRAAGTGPRKSKGPDLAAGTAKTPIMQAHIEERELAAVPNQTPPLPSTSSEDVVRAATTVEGYVPRGPRRTDAPGPRSGSDRVDDVAAAQRSVDRRVHFAAELDDGGAGGARSVPAPAPVGREAGEGAAPAAESRDSVLQPAKFVMEVEDADSTVEEGQRPALGSLFGRLRLADGGAPGADADEAGDARQAAGHDDDDTENGRLHSNGGHSMARGLRRGLTALNPHLGGVLPPGRSGSDGGDVRQSSDEESDAGSASSGDEGEGLLGLSLDTSSDEDDCPSDDGGDHKPGRPKYAPSLFSTLLRQLETWASPETLELVGSDPGVPAPPWAVGASEERTEPLRRLLGTLLPGMCAELGIADLPAARAALSELLRTLRVADPPPPWRTSHWQLLLLALLKALSLRRTPVLRPAFETRDGIARLNAALAGRLFTVEEFYALLELLVPDSER